MRPPVALIPQSRPRATAIDTLWLLVRLTLVACLDALTWDTMVNMTDAFLGSGGGFEAERAYEVEYNPEFPADGDWGCDVYAFDRDGTAVSEFVARWGAPSLVRVEPARRKEWVGMYPAGGLGTLNGVLATPSPSRLCVVAGGSAFITEVSRPDEGTQLVMSLVEQVVPAREHRLLLLVSPVDVVGLGPGGIAWRSSRLATDGLRVIRVGPNGIECIGDTPDAESATHLLDPSTGKHIAET